jgi:broad specificity phosphatase PhoE
VVSRVTAAMHAIASVEHDAQQAPDAILVISHGGTIRSFIHAIVGVVPPPLDNGTVFRIGFEAGVFVSAERGA